MHKEHMIKTDIQNNIAAITLNRPDIHNAFDDKMIAELSETLDKLAAQDDLVAVILCGAGKSFSAGADLNWMKKAASYSEEENRTDAMALAKMLYKLDTLPQTTIACVQGTAMGGGLGLVACCDIVIADVNTTFALSEVKLGLIPATISPYVLRAIGLRHARRFFQTGERFKGAKAYDIGLVHEITETPEDMDKTLQAFLSELQKNGPHAMRQSKALCLDYSGHPVTTDILKDTADRIAKARSTQEAKDRLETFLNKGK